jgi:repressor LexA
MREIGQAAGLASPSSVKYQLELLEEKGWIRRDPTRGRAIEILLPDQDQSTSSSGDKYSFACFISWRWRIVYVEGCWRIND